MIDRHYEKIDSLLQAGRYDEAINTGIDAFDLSIDARYEPNESDYATTRRTGPIEIGYEAVSDSAATLVSTLYHEGKHVEQRAGNWSRPGSGGVHLNEVEAYQVELDQATRLKLSPAEIGLVRSGYEQHYKALDVGYRKQVERGNFTVRPEHR